MGQKPALGKGLASLLPGAAGVPPRAPAGATAAGPAMAVSQQEAGSRDRHMGISFASVEEIRANTFQPRRDFDDNALQELAQSIRENGIIQPLVVKKSTSGGFELIAGERRLRAAKLAGLKQIPIVIRKTTDRESLELALIENIQREDLNCVDTAVAYFQLVQDFSLTQEEVAKKVGKDRATVANHLRLLRLPEIIVESLKKGLLTFGHGKVLAGIEDPEKRMRVWEKILQKSLSVREAEALAEELRQAAEEEVKGKATTEDPVALRFSNLSQDLTRQWSAKVEVKGSEQRGKIVFHYRSRQELDSLLQFMQNHK